MKNIRIIPKMDIKGPNLVKGVHLEGLRVLGKPENFARYYYESGADELFYFDIVASLYNRNNLLHIVEKTAKEIFIPLTVGGGLRSIEDMRSVLHAGADKIALNTAAIRCPELIKEAARKFGSSNIVISIEAIKQLDGRYLAFTDNGREYTGIDVLEWVVKVVEFGAGEILLTSVDREGTGLGFDIELLKRVSELVDDIPIIACGGAGKLEHIESVILEGKVDAVCLSSLLHYDFIEKFVTEGDFSDEGNIEFLKDKRRLLKIQPTGIEEIKSYLSKKAIKCRYYKREISYAAE